MVSVVGVRVAEIEGKVKPAVRIHLPRGNVIKPFGCLKISFALLRAKIT
jgi:hypothetical protein